MATTEVFMSNRQYTDEFKAKAVKQVIERGLTVVDVVAWIGGSKQTLYGWVQSARKASRGSGVGAAAVVSDSVEVRRLKTELKRVTEERDILKKLPRTLPGGKGEVRVHARPRPRPRVPTGGDVPGARRAPQRPPRLAARWHQCT